MYPPSAPRQKGWRLSGGLNHSAARPVANMRNQISNVLKFFAIFLFLKAGSAFAVITCNIDTVKTFTTTLNATISAGADKPPGSVIYASYAGRQLLDRFIEL